MAQDSHSKQPDMPPPRRNRTEAVGQGAATVGREIFARAGFRDPTLVTHWADIAGSEVARLCQPLKLSEGAGGGVLTLKAEPSAALFLQHESRALCERINGYLGRPAIARLKFVQSPLAARPARRSRPTQPGPVPPNDPATKYQGPEPVREALLKLARRRAVRRPPD
jgi:hypothetical protein